MRTIFLKQLAFISVVLTSAFVLGSHSSNVSAQADPVFVGSFVVEDGPDWNTNPPVYSAREAAALLFGGNPEDYAISTNPDTSDPTTITNTAFYDGWGQSCGSEFAEDFSVDDAPAGYRDPGGIGSSWSAYVSDHGCTEVNYVWRIASPIAVPVAPLWMLLSLGALLSAAAASRLRSRV